MSNMGLRKAMKQEGINRCETTLCDKYVYEAMVATDGFRGAANNVLTADYACI